MPDKIRLGCSILNKLLDYGKTIKHQGYHKIRIGRNVIGVIYHDIHLASLYAREKLGYILPHPTNIRSTNHSLYIGFRGKLGFYKNFSMYFVYVDNDDGTMRLRSISEKQFHNEIHPYWSTVYGMPFTEDRIYSMIYDALNIAFDYNDSEKKFNNLIQKIKMAAIREV